MMKLVGLHLLPPLTMEMYMRALVSEGKIIIVVVCVGSMLNISIFRIADAPVPQHYPGRDYI